MQVILLDNVRNLGHLGELVKVKPGFARNFLIPQGKAAPATKANLEKFEERRAELEKLAAANLASAQQRADALANLTVTIAARAGDEGKLFGSLGTRDVADAVTKAGVAIEKSEVRLPEGPLRAIGEFDIAVQLHPEVSGSVKVNVVPEAA